MAPPRYALFHESDNRPRPTFRIRSREGSGRPDRISARAALAVQASDLVGVGEAALAAGDGGVRL